MKTSVLLFRCWFCCGLHPITGNQCVCCIRLCRHFAKQKRPRWTSSIRCSSRPARYLATRHHHNRNRVTHRWCSRWRQVVVPRPPSASNWSAAQRHLHQGRILIGWVCVRLVRPHAKLAQACASLILLLAQPAQVCPLSNLLNNIYLWRNPILIF